MEQYAKALRQGRAWHAQGPEAEQRCWAAEEQFAELTQVSDNLAGNAGLSPSATTEAHTRAGWQ